MLVHEYLEASARRSPHKLALVCDGQRLTYRELDEGANRLAHGLLAAGLLRGDRVAIWLPNSVEAVMAIYACLKAGGTFVVINATTKPDKLAYVLNNCQARCLFAPASRLAEVTSTLQNVPSLTLGILCGEDAPEADSDHSLISLGAMLATSPPERPTVRCIDLDLACLIYTSGSTGEPKGVMSTHANVSFAANAIISYLENVPDDIVINVLPLAFDYGLYQLLMTMTFGGTLVLERSFAYPAAVLKRIEEERVTGLPGVPTVYAMLLQMDLGRFDLSSLRYLTNTAAALPVEHIQRLRDAFPWARLYSMYGLTECKGVSYLPPEEVDRRPRSVGIAMPNTEVWVEDAGGNRLGPGQVGELVVRGAHVTRGYWEDPEATMRAFGPGPFPGETVLHTGDLFTMDADGFLYFVGRQDDIIKTRGEKVSPREVENVLYGLPETAEAAVVGVPDPVLGEAIKAYIVPLNGSNLTEQDVIRHCRIHLEDHMVPTQIEFCIELPKTDSGKIHKAGLRREAQHTG